MGFSQQSTPVSTGEDKTAWSALFISQTQFRIETHAEQEIDQAHHVKSVSNKNRQFTKLYLFLVLIVIVNELLKFSW